MSDFFTLYSAFDQNPTYTEVSQPLLLELLKHEEEAQFESFTHKDAESLLKLILSNSPRGKDPTNPSLRPIVASVFINGNMICYLAQEGTCQDNFRWVQRKANSVARFGHSTIYEGSISKSKGLKFSERYHVSEEEFVGDGGGFPLRIKGVSYPIGSIIVSGLPHFEDHYVIVSSIKEYLASK
ncbi:hypothetical protein V1511DRAFT_464217 [Dipodascopsis uninucleata]